MPIFVSSEHSWVSCSDTRLYSILTPLVSTTTQILNTGVSELPEEAAVQVSGFGEAPFGVLLRDINGNEVPGSVPMIYCIYPHVLLVEHFWDTLKRISSSAYTFWSLRSFVQVDVLSLLTLSDVEKDPFAAVRKYQSYSLLPSECRFDTGFWHLKPMEDFDKSLDLESTPTSELNFSASEFYVVLSHTWKVEDKGVQNTALIA